MLPDGDKSHAAKFHGVVLIHLFSKVSRLRRLMRRSTTSKYRQLTALKVAARENGWTAKRKTTGKDHGEGQDGNAAGLDISFQSFGDFLLADSDLGVFEQLKDFNSSGHKLLAEINFKMCWTMCF